MNTNLQFSKAGVAAMLAVVSGTASAGGYPVFDAIVNTSLQTVNASIQAVNGSITTMNTSLSNLLQQIGGAVNQNGAKISSTVEATGRAQREFDTVQEKNRRVEDARQRYLVPSSICSEAGSGGVDQVRAATGTAKGGLRPGGGGGVSSPAIRQALTAPPQSPDVDAARSAKVHSSFCDADDHLAYGGSKACPAVSSKMPGADKRVDSILLGAGANGKAPDLTFSQDQIDAARMYTQNAVRRSVAPQLKKGEADTDAGIQYVGLMNQFNALISAAADPQDQLVAESVPNPATRSLLSEALLSPSASAYYKVMASPEVRRTGVMSAREFELFEAGRRYANTEYQADLQALSGDNLIREQIRVASLTNWLLLKLKGEVQRGNIIQGNLLGSVARQEYQPILAQKYRAVGGRMGGQ